MLHVMLISPFDRNGHGGRTGSVGVRATGTAVAGDHIRHAFLDRAIAAIPTSIAHAEIDDRTPRSIVRRMPRGSAEYRACRQASGDNRKFDRGAHYFASFWDLRPSTAPDVVFIGPLPGTEAAAGGGE